MLQNVAGISGYYSGPVGAGLSLVHIQLQFL